jgi:voltage-gated potassium channel
MSDEQEKAPAGGWRLRLHTVIFEADTAAGKAFDVALIVSILLSVAVVMADSVQSLHVRYAPVFYALEWFFTVLFTIEYILRLLCVRRPASYARSFFGIVDLLAILPTYVSILVPGSRHLMAIRLLRVLRVFRVFKLAPYVGEARMLMRALRASRRKIMVFLFTVLILVTVLGSLIYVVEGGENGFTSIPVSVYWAVVTLTTVGYGDISPQTGLGQAIASVIMILGYSIIAVPTGFVSVEMVQMNAGDLNTQSCPNCSAGGHDGDAAYCKYCGARL